MRELRKGVRGAARAPRVPRRGRSQHPRLQAHIASQRQGDRMSFAKISPNPVRLAKLNARDLSHEKSAVQRLGILK
jgi:hypothetical protein